MKKTYIQPQTIVVSLQTEGMVAASFRMNETYVDTSNGEQLTNKKGSSLWGRDEEETDGGFW